MGKPRSLAILMLGLACVFLIACQTPGTPKQSKGTPKKSEAAAGPQVRSNADSASPNRTASKSKEKRSVRASKQKDPKGGAVDRAIRPLKAIFGQRITTLRAILYATLGLIVVVVLGAIAAERAGRHRKLAPSTANARH